MEIKVTSDIKSERATFCEIKNLILGFLCEEWAKNEVFQGL